ncbi:MAG: aminopeptidase P family protein [Methanomicrobiaceae archaeon]|nr:aminopeptidase P family protein [Methanomicrobiaceae archaeon]
MDALDTALESTGASAFVMYASSQDANLRYLTGFSINDPVVYIKKAGERGLLIVPQMEYARATAESSCAVMSRAEAGFFEIVKEEPDRWRALAQMIANIAGGGFLLPASSPFALGRALQAHGTVQVDNGTVEDIRAVKRPDEIEAIRTAQRAAEQAMAHAVARIRDAGVLGGMLVEKDGTALTSATIRQEMHILLLRQGCRGVDTIISCGEETAMPHRLGEGPLAEGEPVVIDIFPRDERTGYYADMTRTVVKGEPSPEIREMYDAVREAQALSIGKIRAGVTGKDVHQAVVDFFSDRGYESGAKGFVHSLGHGVGLDIHELPALGPSGGELKPGNVVTVEPGLYFPGIGGVRLEDMGVVTAEGFDRFTRFLKELCL